MDGRSVPWLAIALSVLLLFLCMVSLLLGAGDLTLGQLLDPSHNAQAWQLLLISRLPRTLALMLAGTSMAVAGMIMQMLVRNRFVEPSTTGTVESATLGILAVTLLAPNTSVLGRMVVATVFALAGTALFVSILRRIPLRSPFLVPVVGLVLGGVVQAVTTFFAYQYDLMQSLHTWTTRRLLGGAARPLRTAMGRLFISLLRLPGRRPVDCRWHG